MLVSILVIAGSFVLGFWMEALRESAIEEEREDRRAYFDAVYERQRERRRQRRADAGDES